MKRFFLVFITLNSLCLSYAQPAAFNCLELTCNPCQPATRQPPSTANSPTYAPIVETVTDFVFLIDTSSSMQTYIDAVRNGLLAFFRDIQSRDITPYFSIVLFGMKPELVLDWSQDANEIETVLSQIVAGNPNLFDIDPPLLIHSDHDCKCGNTIPINYLRNDSFGYFDQGEANVGNCGPCSCSCSTREAFFESITMAMNAWPTAGESLFDRHPLSRTAELEGLLQFHQDSDGNPAKKFFIGLTDEDSDCPFHAVNRIGDCENSGYGVYKEESDRLTEIDVVVDALVDEDSWLFLFMDDIGNSDWSRRQFGAPEEQAHDVDTFQNYNETQTLLNLEAAGLGDCWQARAIREKLARNPDGVATYRVFDINEIGANQEAVANFFAEVVNAVDLGCFSRRKRDDEPVCSNYRCSPESGCYQEAVCDVRCDNQCHFADDSCALSGSYNEENACEVCWPHLSKNEWLVCEDLSSCTTSMCLDGQCVHEPICEAQCYACTINGTCVLGGQGNPLDDCYYCEPQWSDTAWCGKATSKCAARGIEPCIEQPSTTVAAATSAYTGTETSTTGTGDSGGTTTGANDANTGTTSAGDVVDGVCNGEVEASFSFTDTAALLAACTLDTVGACVSLTLRACDIEVTISPPSGCSLAFSQGVGIGVSCEERRRRQVGGKLDTEPMVFSMSPSSTAIRIDLGNFDDGVDTARVTIDSSEAVLVDTTMWLRAENEADANTLGGGGVLRIGAGSDGADIVLARLDVQQWANGALKQPEDDPNEDPFPWWIWLIVAGVCCLLLCLVVICVLMRLRSKRAAAIAAARPERLSRQRSKSNRTSTHAIPMQRRTSTKFDDSQAPPMVRERSRSRSRRGGTVRAPSGAADPYLPPVNAPLVSSADAPPAPSRTFSDRQRAGSVGERQRSGSMSRQRAGSVSKQKSRRDGNLSRRGSRRVKSTRLDVANDLAALDELMGGSDTMALQELNLGTLEELKPLPGSQRGSRGGSRHRSHGGSRSSLAGPAVVTRDSEEMNWGEVDNILESALGDDMLGY